MHGKWKYLKMMGLGTSMVGAMVLAGCPDEPAAPEVPGPPPGEQPPPNMGEAPPPSAEGAAAAPAEGAPPAEGAAAEAPPPGGAPPPPGAPAPASIKLDKLPPGVQTQEQLKQSGQAVTVKGMIVGDVCKGKPVRLDAIEIDDKGMVKLMALLNVADIGHYEMVVPKSEKKLWLTAFCDVNGDGLMKPAQDAVGGYASNPFIPNKELTEVVIRMTQNEREAQGLPPAPKGGTPPAPPMEGAPPPAPEGAAPPASAKPADAARPADAAKPKRGK